MRTLITTIAILVSVLSGTETCGQSPSRIWLSDSGSVPGDPNTPIAISVTRNEVLDLYIWAQSPATPAGTTLRNFSLNVITTGKIDLLDGADDISVNTDLFEFTYDSMPDGPACDSLSAVASCAPPLRSEYEASADDTLPSPDRIRGISGVTLAPRSAFPGVNGTQRIASIRYRALEVGQTSVHLQIGANGMNHQDIQGIVIPSGMTEVRFSNGPSYNASSDRGINGAVGDALITISATPPLPGDYDGNGRVEPADYDEWKSAFGNVVTPYSSADGNGNGAVEAADYTIWRDNLISSSANTFVSPETSTAMMVALAGMLLTICRLRV